MRRVKLLAATLILIAFGAVSPVVGEAATLGDDGLHKQPWFVDSFLTLADDVEEAAAEGKRLVVFFEQRGCPYCAEMHEVNLARPEISDFIQEHFFVVQLDLWGSREVVDLDGEAMEERDLARKWHVNFTPSVVFFGTAEEVASGKGEVARMPGYFKPFHFMSMFEFVQSGSYQTEGFQRFLQTKFEELKKKGIDPDVW